MQRTVYDGLSSPFFAFLLALVGLSLGSFASVLVARIPSRESLMTRSKCPNCSRQITPKENIPVLSYLVLKGKCPGCNSKISTMYPALELGMAILYVAPLFFLHNWTQFLLWVVLATFGLPLLAIDLIHHRLPDVLTASLFGSSALVILGSSITHNRFDRIAPSATGAISLLAFYLAIMLISRGGMGMGDVKLSASIGLISGYFGMQAVLISSFGAFTLGSVIGIVLILFGKAGRKTAIPFGPFMLVGQLISMVVMSRI